MIISPAYAATAGAAHGPFYAEPEFWLLVAFVIFVGLMAKPVWRKVTAGLDTRAAEIAAQLDEARQLREEAQATLASYQRKQRDAAKKAEEIIAHAQDEATRLTQAAEKTLAETLKRHEALTVEKIAQAQTRAVDEVKAEAVEIALAATRRLLEERLDEAKGDALIEDAIRELPAKLQ
ncbi:MAG: F-type H+-transporting ATPase subunit b [Alphaproteobacteria bacterium]|jgi:F-type H+-transporting ATPase subunit b